MLASAISREELLELRDLIQQLEDAEVELEEPIALDRNAEGEWQIWTGNGKTEYIYRDGEVTGIGPDHILLT